MTATEHLQKYFGYDQFRPGQRELVEAILSGRDCLGIMPTGAGKSICFQIPALMLPGITLVVSPLISLMKDQVGALGQAGIPAAYLNSSLSPRQIELVLQNARQGKYKLIYIAPERLLTPSFLHFAQTHLISMVTVDEAHCISQWGQDFRPSYVQIPEFVAQLPQRPILSAFTATATQQVREDIFRLLNLQSPELLITGFDRTNLFFEVQHPHKKLPALLDFLYAHRGESGIIYCNTRKNVEQVCEDLTQRDINAAPYHAGLEPEQRRQAQDDFLYDRTPIMVATNAFGMGIDKSNVSFVVHYNMPMDMESYYQEAGRAGRDGSPAHCLLLYNAKDVQTNRWMIDQDSDNLYADPEQEEFLKQQGHQRLKKMTFYCTLPHCLRGYILKYFGEKPASQCDNCSNCVSESHLVDVTVESQKLISCILRMGSRYGHKMVIDVLRGESNDRITQQGLDMLPTYGISQESEEFLRQLVNFLEGEGYLGRSEGDYPTLFVTENARTILRGEQSLSMRQFEGRPKRGRKPASATAVAPERMALFDRLKKLRGRLAALQGVPAFVVVSDKTLIDLCDKLPTNQFELLRVSGIGEQKAAQYGQKFLAEIILFCQEED